MVDFSQANALLKGASLLHVLSGRHPFLALTQTVAAMAAQQDGADMWSCSGQCAEDYNRLEQEPILIEEVIPGEIPETLKYEFCVVRHCQSPITSQRPPCSFSAPC